MKTVQTFSSLLFGVLAFSNVLVYADPFSGFSFDSASTGADGTLALTAEQCPSAGTVVTLDVGTTGVKNYTSVSVHSNCIVKFTPVGSGSAPVRWIVQGDVLIGGHLNLDGSPGKAGSHTMQAVGGLGGSGGYDGGNGAVPVPAGGSGSRDGYSGYGPGGGRGGDASSGIHSLAGGQGYLRPLMNSPADQPLVGGSGGGGASRQSSSYSSGSGGGGGGALLIASSGKVTLDGGLSALGGIGGNKAVASRDGGSGAGGVIHLIANTIDGTGDISATYSILETLNYSGSFTTRTSLNVISFQQLTLTQGPTLAISSVDGKAVAVGEGLILDGSGDIQVVVTSSNLPAGTQVTLVATGESSSASRATITLDANGTATGTMSIISGLSLITAYVSAFVE